MRTLFVTVINMSYTASFVIASVLILRLLMRRLPKLFTNLLWVMVLVRLLCPISFETLWSVLPSGQLLPTDLDQLNPFEIHSGIAAIDLPVNEALLRSDYEGASKVVSILAAVWLCGVAATMTIGIVKSLRKRGQVTEAVKIKWQLPMMLMWAAVSLHWMNPLVWSGYCMAKRDLRAEKMGHYPGERWVVGVLILLLMLLFFAGNPLPMEKNLRAGTYDGIKVLYSEVAVEDPTDVSSLPKFEVTEQRELLVDGRNVGKLVASSWERIEDQNLITMSSDANRYGDQHVDNKEIYKTDPLPEGTYYVVNAYEPERLEILQIQGVILWKVYEAEYGEIWDKE